MAFAPPALPYFRQPLRRCVSSYRLRLQETGVPTPGALKRPRSRRATATASYSTTANALESVNNPRIKAARALLRRRHRQSAGKVLLEGHRLVLDALSAGLLLEEVYYTAGALSRGARSGALRRALASCRATLVSERVMGALSDVVTPPGVVAVAARPARALGAAASLVLVCDGVQDPGNVGALVRAAAGAGAHGVVCTPGCADPWGQKALRAGMGAQLRVPVLPDLNWAEAEELLRTRGFSICVADGAGSTPYVDVDWARPAALVVGSEASGPSAEALEAASVKVAVPMANEIESLNAAVAGGVILFEASRQRNLISLGK